MASHSLRLAGYDLGLRRLCLFDMDGILYDSMPNHAIAWIQAMASFGISFTADDAYATEGARGVDTVRHYVRQQTGHDISEEKAMDMYQEKARVFATLPVAPVIPEVIPLMRKIKAQGLTIGVVTGSAQRPLIERVVNDFHEFISPDHIVTAYDVERGKPHPDPYIKGMSKCGDFRPDETIVIENAPLGVHSGHASGAYTIAVNTGPLADEILLHEGADILFPDMQALADAWEQVIT